MPHREGHIGKYPSPSPCDLDFSPRDEHWGMHDSEQEHASQIQSLWIGPEREQVAVVCEPTHLGTLHCPRRSIKRCCRPVDSRQREPTTDDADSRADKAPERHEEYGKNHNPVLVEESPNFVGWHSLDPQIKHHNCRKPAITLTTPAEATLACRGRFLFPDAKSPAETRDEARLVGDTARAIECRDER